MPAVLHPIAKRVSSTSEAGVLEPEDYAWGTAPGAAAGFETPDVTSV